GTTGSAAAESGSALRHIGRMATTSNHSTEIIMIKLTTALVSLGLILGGGAACAEGGMAHDTMSKGSKAKEEMSTGSMAKDSMSGTDEMQKDAMSKGTMTKDEMTKDAMSKGGMAKDAMTK
ncbi:pentapeptide MXKDX repeat protein, partial [uncultured Thiocystis sp.]|uniref:pentapeptide MXKDX repeat protein n=1 Tax=uncultured Thiocystis sp. TaxID=1202134 RepID=UPI0026005AC8